MNISIYLMISNSIRSKKIQGSASFYCFNRDPDHGNHNLFLLIVVATETIEQFDLIE